jgi:hypothetical protein
MPMPTLAERRARLRQLVLLREPCLWKHWPFLPLIRRSDGSPECGFLFDARRVCDRYGYSATVFLGSLLRLPPAAGDVLSMDREVYDTAEEVYASGWRTD